VLTFGREYTPVKNKRYKGRPIQLKDLPPFQSRRLVLDEEGNLWIHINSENEDEMVYDVFSPEGIYLKQVTLPHRIFQFKNGKIYSIAVTEEGFRVIKRFRLTEY